MPTRKLPEHIRLLRQSFKDLMLREIGRCEHPDCQKPNYKVGLVVHECLVPMAFMQKSNNEELMRHILFHPINVLLLHNSPCHLHKKPSIEKALEIVTARRRAFYEMFQLRDSTYAMAHFYETFGIFQNQKVIKILPIRPANYDRIFSAKNSPIILR